jgi:hypothetical protein
MARGKSSKAEVTTLDLDVDAIRAREIAVEQEPAEEIIARLAGRFDILHDMTKAVKSGEVRAMIVSGPPGVGKSYGVENILERHDLLQKVAQRPPKFEIVKGAMSPLGLYTKLHEFKEKGNVLVFDDCDVVLFDDLCLNILKAALDSSDKRVICWNTDSRLLRAEGIPGSFDFKGAAIFITNIKFEHVRSKKIRAHLEALESRCHYIDLQMDTPREKLLWIQHVITEKEMLTKRDVSELAQKQVLKFMMDNKEHLRELSLRMALKLADLRASFPQQWQNMAATTCMRRK